jgi:transcriptional regulator with XRE-family HTH domain
MNGNSAGTETPFWAAVAAEVRATAARKRVSGSELARRLGKTQSWVSRRMVGDIPLGLDDLEGFAAALEVSPFDLLPRPRDYSDQGTENSVIFHSSGMNPLVPALAA